MQILNSRSGIGRADASKSPSSPSRLRKSGLAFALGATAVIASAPLQTANAAIVYSGILNIAVGSGGIANVGGPPAPYFTFNNNTNSKGQASLYLTPDTSTTQKNTVVILATAQGAPILTSGVQTTANYGTGVSISAESTFSTMSNVYVDYFVPGPNLLTTPADVYVGFSFTNGPNTDYGWAQFTVGAGHTPFTLVDYAIEDHPGTAILTGATGTSVPEPASVALLALGSGGMLMRRRRRAETTTL